MTDTKTAPRNYMDLISEDPNGFLRTTEVWCVHKPLDGRAEDSTIVKYDEPCRNRTYPADASLISKVVLAKGPNGEKIMCMAATGLHDVLHLMEVLRTMDFGKVQWTTGHAKAEFAAPAVQKHAFIIRVKPDIRDGKDKIIKRGDTEAVVLSPTNLVNMEGEMIMIQSREHQGVQPDWVYNWSFAATKSDMHIVALTGGGKLLELVNDRNGTRRYRDLTPKDAFVNDVVTIPRVNGEVEFVLATSRGIIYKGSPIMGTGSLDISNLCYDTEAQALWIHTRDNKVYRVHLESGRCVTPEAWSNVPMIFQDAASHKLLCGSGVPAPILTAWSRPREIMGKDPETKEPVGTGKFSMAYYRMEVTRMIQSADSRTGENANNTEPRVC